MIIITDPHHNVSIDHRSNKLQNKVGLEQNHKVQCTGICKPLSRQIIYDKPTKHHKCARYKYVQTKTKQQVRRSPDLRCRHDNSEDCVSFQSIKLSKQ